MIRAYWAEYDPETTEDKYENYFSKTELEDIRRSKTKHSYHQTLTGRYMAKSRLSRCLHVPVRDIVLRISSTGRPGLKDQGELWDFNITDAGSLLAVAVSDQGKVGIDIEQISTPDSGLMRQVLSEKEEKYVARPGGSSAARFCSLWTIKESFIKAQGSGLGAIDPRDIEIITDNRKKKLVCKGRSCPADFFQSRINTDYILTICSFRPISDIVFRKMKKIL